MMETITKNIEKLKPHFEKLSRNKYLRAVRDGFMAAMPVILFSSIFMLIAFVPNVFGFYWSESIEAMIVKPYQYSMGVIGILVAATTAKSLTDSFNRELPTTNQLNHVSVMLVSMVGFLLLAVDPVENGFSTGYMGTTGLLAAFISAFISANVYKLFIKNDIAIKMPEEVPPNIAQAFSDVLPFGAAVLLVYAIDLLIRHFVGVSFAQTIIEMFQPLFTAADGYLGLAIISGAISFFWFIGIHGPSIVEPAISAIMFVNLDLNLQLLQNGEHASHALTPGLQHFVITLGGTGATFVVPYLFMLLGKSKQNKAIGRASFIPTSFGVNEPILFGAPIVLNPIFFVPFVLAPIVNVWLFKFFVDVLNMNSFSYFLPWPTPAPVGLVLGTGFAAWAFVLAVILLVIDTLIYYPFFKAYDNELLERERQEEATLQAEHRLEALEEETEAAELAAIHQGITDETAVLVLCAGGGTSGLLANSLNKAAEEYDAPVKAQAGSYGAHRDILPEFDLVILAPQIMSNYDDIKLEADAAGVQVVKTQGKQYIDLTRDPEGSLKFVNDSLHQKE